MEGLDFRGLRGEDLITNQQVRGSALPVQSHDIGGLPLRPSCQGFHRWLVHHFLLLLRLQHDLLQCGHQYFTSPDFSHGAHHIPGVELSLNLVPVVIHKFL